VLALSVGVATAIGGNSTNAKLCQKNGWKTLYRSDGSAFANQDACVAYAAKGGTFVTGGKLTIDLVVVNRDLTSSNAQDFPFVMSGASSQTFSLDSDNSDATLPDSRVFNLPPGSYTVAPVLPAPSGWTVTAWGCFHQDANTTLDVASASQPPSATIGLAVLGDATCTFTFTENPA